MLNVIGKNIKVKFFPVIEYGERLENDVNKWLSNCKETVFDIQYQHCFNAWGREQAITGVGMEREFSVMIVYGKKDGA